MAQAVNCLPLTVETRVWYQGIRCDICSEQCGTDTGFCRISVVPCRYDSTNVLYLFSFIYHPRCMTGVASQTSLVGRCLRGKLGYSQVLMNAKYFSSFYAFFFSVPRTTVGWFRLWVLFLFKNLLKIRSHSVWGECQVRGYFLAPPFPLACRHIYKAYSKKRPNFCYKAFIAHFTAF